MKQGSDWNDIGREKGPDGTRSAFDAAASANNQRVNGAIKSDSKNYASRVTLIPFDQIRLGTARRELVKGLIPRVGLTIVWGPPKSGKSFWVFDLVMHVALGREYRGRRVHRGSVVYCAFEGQTGIETRVEAFRRRFLDGEHEPVPFYLEPVMLDLVRDHAELIVIVRGQLADRLPVVVVLDTLNRSLRGSESNDEDMTAYIQAADAIREAFSCAVIIVHHCGIDGTRPRGHTSLTGAVDAQLSVTRDDADNIIVEYELVKDDPQGETIASRLEVVEVGTDEDGERITSCVIVPSDGTAAPKRACDRPRLPKSARIALKAIRMAMDEMGEVPPAANHIPPNVKTVTLEKWRKYAYAKGISTSNEPRARQAAFKRAVEALLAAEAVVSWEDHYWTNP